MKTFVNKPLKKDWESPSERDEIILDIKVTALEEDPSLKNFESC